MYSLIGMCLNKIQIKKAKDDYKKIYFIIFFI